MIPRRKPYEDSPSLRHNIITVATPGITAQRSQLSRYTGVDGVDVLENTCSWQPHVGFVASKDHAEAELVAFQMGHEKYALTAEEDPPLLYHASCRVAPRLLHNVMASPEMDEIVYNKCSFNPLHWLLMLKEIFTSLAFSVYPRRCAYSQVRMTNIGGKRDQAVCQREIRRAVRIIKKTTVISQGDNDVAPHLLPGRSPPLKLVLFGCSRGATAIFYTAMKLPLELAQYVSLVVVEAPFDTLHNVITSSCWFPRFTLWFVRNFCEYDGDEPYSFDPDRVQLRCPIAFVMSRQDTRVPNKLTRRLIDTVKRECPQIPAVEVLQLKHSRHPLMAVGNREDQDAYVAFMEQLYDTYCS
ncbi:hypothetical protein TRSC58_06628 [Trypanosoma rangeli SC58]|uniref:Peptidase S9 prolyl oligopeptidase catalytic domain-containing protein n=2 Tax=Trypanosoma rangeli SC58 TaxID=429131 RepID=A0A061ISC4_TRYRA|nr:hypothetical protein TRSC58_06628 [Trypanosoma rangeli SC58]